MKSFGKRLRAARIAAGLTQEQLGFALGVTKSSVSAWENDRETPTFRILPDLRNELHRSLDELVCGIGTEPTATGIEADIELKARDPSEEALLTRFRALSANRREAILELMKPSG